MAAVRRIVGRQPAGLSVSATGVAAVRLPFTRVFGIPGLCTMSGWPEPGHNNGVPVGTTTVPAVNAPWLAGCSVSHYNGLHD